jgi:serine/threonine protein kinase
MMLSWITPNWITPNWITPNWIKNLYSENYSIKTDSINYQFAHYDIIDEGINKVYRGYYNDIKIAIKVININNNNDMIRAKREIDILKGIDHDHIVRYIDGHYDKDVKKVKIITEFCNGVSLLSAFENDQVDRTEDNCKKIIKQLLEIVGYLHKNKICHRDIKPANMLYDVKNGDIVLCDFGLASIGKKKLHETCGSPFFIAPEMWLNLRNNKKPGYNNKVDLWSIGIIICIFMFNDIPFFTRSKSLHKMGDIIINNKPNINISKWQKASVDCRDLITRLLDKNPKTRLSARVALLHPWFKQR